MPYTVTLADVLAARDARAARQKALLSAHPGCALVCFTVNTPGPVKKNTASDRVHEAGRDRILTALSGARMLPVHAEYLALRTGDEAYFLVPAEAAAVKALACALEDTLPYGRLLDIDVLNAAGEHLSRTALGYPARGCMVCGEAGAGCARSRKHTLAELDAAFLRLADAAYAEEEA